MSEVHALAYDMYRRDCLDCGTQPKHPGDMKADHWDRYKRLAAGMITQPSDRTVERCLERRETERANGEAAVAAAAADEEEMTIKANEFVKVEILLQVKEEIRGKVNALEWARNAGAHGHDGHARHCQRQEGQGVGRGRSRGGVGAMKSHPR